MKNLLITFILLFQVTLVYPQIQLGQDIDGESSADQSATSVSLSSNGYRVAIGSPFNVTPAHTNPRGSVRVYDYDVPTLNWVQVGSDIDGTNNFMQSGKSVSLSNDGSRIAVGSEFGGYVKIYDLVAGTWSQVGSNIVGSAIVGIAGTDRFGSKVQLSGDGNRLVISAPKNDFNGQDAGAVSIFEFDGANWVQIGANIYGDAAFDAFGFDVALNEDGTVLAIGSPYHNTNKGLVKVYNYNGTNWIQMGTTLEGPVIVGGANFGTSVDINSVGNRIVIGAPISSPSGLVYTFDYDGINWSQLGSPIAGENTGDWFGEAVSISGDGERICIGSRYNDGSFSNAGSARVYGFNMGISDWVQISIDIDGEDSGDEYGAAVSISSDGLVVAIGSMLNDGNGSNAGHVRVFELSPILPIELLDFSATPKVDRIQLNWETASEINNDYFTIERSKNAQDWQEVKKVDGAGNSSSILSYSEVDNNPYNEVSYYRLKQTDFDGHFSYSRIRSVNIIDLVSLKIYPNPTNSQITITGNISELGQVKFYNVLGQNVTSFTTLINHNKSKLIMDLSNLNTGMYYIKTKTTTYKMYKQ